MPLGLFLALAGRLVAPGVGGGDAEIGDRPPVLGAPNFGILAEISNQNDLVYASRHRRSPLPEITGLSGSSTAGWNAGLRTILGIDPIRSTDAHAGRSPGY